jgi:hypothetical protein
MSKKGLCMMLMGMVLCVLGGCSYYKITDPRTSKVYYTTGIDERKGGAVVLTDKKTNKKVTLQDSEIEKISKEAYNANNSAEPIITVF